jgi:uncharacterized iron-regulated membrane protein
MRELARWHIWVGWAVAVPLLLWTVSGVFMALKPLDEVRGSDLAIERPELPVKILLAGGTRAALLKSGHLTNQRGRSILIATYVDGTVARLDLDSGGAKRLPPVDAAEARAATAWAVRGGKRVAGVRLFAAGTAPLDFRKAMAAWQVTLADGTRVYVGRDTGEIEAVRTPFWRAYDLMWGLHIMNLQDREEPSRLFLIPFGLAALASCLIGTVLLFRRRRRVRA